MEIILEGKDAEDWIYRGEGAANLVLGYSGSSPAFVGKIIRVQKAPVKGSESVSKDTIITSHERLLWKDEPEILMSPSKEILSQLFVLQIMSPLLGCEHVDAGVHVQVSKGFLESVEKKFCGQRPVWRIDAAKVDTRCDSALLMSDHSLFPLGLCTEEHCIAVEIKPKCGFLPCSSFIAEANAVKKRITRFKMHQMLKFRQGEISQLSLYDPVDLFSGSRGKIKRAVRALLTTPQNNFRAFLDGFLIYGGLGGYSEAGCPLTGTCEKSKEFVEMLNGVIKCDSNERISCFIELVAETLYDSGILNKLLEVQKLDLFDIEGAIHAYYDITSQPCSICKNSVDVEMVTRCSFFHSLPLEESIKIVRDYLISATAKDCSLMISFKNRGVGPSKGGYDSICLDSTNQIFDYKIRFIDLDMKPLKKMVYYHELDQKIVRSYLNHAVMTGSCDDLSEVGEEQTNITGTKDE